MTTQMQALSESLDEAKARLSKLSEQMAQTQTILTTLPAQSNPPAGRLRRAPGAAPTTAAPPVPDADSLYTQGLSYYNGGQYDLSIQAFQDYLKYYKDTDRASNAQFYIGECYYSQGDYNHAIEAYDLCSGKISYGKQSRRRAVEKGLLRCWRWTKKRRASANCARVIQRFPDSHEADLARQRLKKLGISTPRQRQPEGTLNSQPAGFAAASHTHASQLLHRRKDRLPDP